MHSTISGIFFLTDLIRLERGQNIALLRRGLAAVIHICFRFRFISGFLLHDLWFVSIFIAHRSSGTSGILNWSLSKVVLMIWNNLPPTFLFDLLGWYYFGLFYCKANKLHEVFNNSHKKDLKNMDIMRYVLDIWDFFSLYAVFFRFII